MITGSYCRNDASARHRPPPIERGFAFAVVTSYLARSVIQEFGLASSPSRIGAMSSADVSTGCRHHAQLRAVKSP
jgi:hypothetical protein